MSRALQIVLLGLAGLLAVVPQSARAHSLAPLLLEIDVTDEAAFDLMLRRSRRSTAGSRLRIELPESCSLTRDWSLPVLRENRLVERSARMHCDPPSLAGQTLGARGLPESGVALLIRIKQGDQVLQENLLNAAQSQWVVPGEADAESVGWPYLWAGFEHLLIGLDHVLLVIALTLLMPGLRALVGTVTAFTLGHSLSLAFATFGWIRLPQLPVEILIAASLVPLALELLNEQSSRWRARLPWLAIFIGLLHGLGFAGVLGEIGLPPNQQFPALLSFNIGIELAQLLIVFTVLAASKLCKLSVLLPERLVLRSAPAYVIGSVACYWCLERALTLTA